MSLKITSSQRTPGLFVVSLDGSLKYDTCTILQEEINLTLAASPKMIVFDMDRLEFLSSAGVREIIKVRKAMKEKDGEVTFMNFQPQVKRVLEIINLIPEVKDFNSMEELEEYFRTV
ncbi:STAS domain-containing protein [Thermodesulfobacteriota bacterium]